MQSGTRDLIRSAILALLACATSLSAQSEPVKIEIFSEAIAGRISGARMVVIPGAGHQPFQELPEEYNRLLDEFWRSVG